MNIGTIIKTHIVIPDEIINPKRTEEPLVVPTKKEDKEREKVKV